jgi:hypothetical protein
VPLKAEIEPSSEPVTPDLDYASVGKVGKMKNIYRSLGSGIFCFKDQLIQIN